MLLEKYIDTICKILVGKWKHRFGINWYHMFLVTHGSHGIWHNIPNTKKSRKLCEWYKKFYKNFTFYLIDIFKLKRRLGNVISKMSRKAVKAISTMPYISIKNLWVIPLIFGKLIPETGNIFQLQNICNAIIKFVLILNIKANFSINKTLN